MSICVNAVESSYPATKFDNTHMCQVETLKYTLPLEGSSIVRESQLKDIMFLGDMFTELPSISLMGRVIWRDNEEMHYCFTLTCHQVYARNNSQAIGTSSPFLEVKEGNLWIVDTTSERLLTINAIFRRLVVKKGELHITANQLEKSTYEQLSAYKDIAIENITVTDITSSKQGGLFAHNCNLTRVEAYEGIAFTDTNADSVRLKILTGKNIGFVTLTNSIIKGNLVIERAEGDSCDDEIMVGVLGNGKIQGDVIFSKCIGSIHLVEAISSTATSIGQIKAMRIRQGVEECKILNPMISIIR